MIIEVSDLSTMLNILQRIDHKKYDAYLVRLQAIYFRPNVTTKGRDTYKFTDISLPSLEKIKQFWGENHIFPVDDIYPEERLR